MRDKKGSYYYPVPANKRVKMYVRDNEGTIEFRLHNEDDPQLWEEHGWISYEMAKRAAEMYDRPGVNPLVLYDFDVALHILTND